MRSTVWWHFRKYKVILLVLLFFALGFASKAFLEKSSFKSRLIAQDGERINQESLTHAIKLSEAFSYLAEKTASAVVYIETERTVEVNPFPFDFFRDPFFRNFPSLPRYRERGAGSGFIISSDGYIVTNNHVIQNAQKITVKLLDGRSFSAEKIGADPLSDVALLKINANNLPTLSFGDSDLIKTGEWVIAIGNPFGLTHTITVGVISAKSRSGIGISDVEDFIQTDAAINPGNSGGPLINLKGEVIGMNTAIFSRSGGYMGIGFAIPSNIVKTVVEQLKSKGKVERGFLGITIQDLTPNLAKVLGIKNVSDGAVITEVMPNSPAYKAGLKEKDVVVGFNGKTVKNALELKSYILLSKPGTEVVLDVIRDNKLEKIKVIVGSPPENAFISKAELEEAQEILEQLGFYVEELTPALAKRLGLKQTKGVVITEVIPESPADYANLTPGMVIDEVNGVKVNNLKDFLKGLKKAVKSKTVLLGIRVNGGRRLVSLSLEEM
ncbi:DegQ family serine endoprotease [Thermodesulfobacterium sp. TA1]|uniref:DegQ family serine endoprotease n=1 Tax=Thermodesulfobacterium sp. TA1 TaxID=2234087 RepID=UPI001232334B|nr:DegQ family serine endoprotease [Thermodesulfobacterium sp. TA1]QER42786.1 DegQ family serine endoprotease [Thermodesulfobacterium sp. TA1]